MPDVVSPATVAGIIGRLGKAATWRVPTTSYDAATGTETVTFTDHSVTITPPFPRKDRLAVGDLTRLGDARALVGASDLLFRPSIGHRVAFVSPALASISTAAADVSFTASTDAIASASAGFGNLPDAGRVILVSGATNAGNNGWHEVTGTPTAATILVTSSLTDESAGASVTITLGEQWEVVSADVFAGDNALYYDLGLKR